MTGINRAGNSASSSSALAAATAKQSNVAMAKLLPRPGSQSTAGNNVGGILFNSQHPGAKGRQIRAVTLLFENYGVNPMIWDLVAVAPAAVHLTPTNAALTFSALQIDGQNTIVVPPYVGVGGASKLIPRVLAVGPIPITGIPRTDIVGDPQLIRVAAHRAPSTLANVDPSFNSSNYAALNALAANTGMKHGTYQSVGTTLANTLTAAVGCLEAGGPQNPVGAIMHYDDQMDEDWFFGDSRTQGQGSTTSYSGFPAYVMWLTATANTRISAANFGTAGMQMADMLEYARQLFTVGGHLPKRASIPVMSPNDAQTQAGHDAARGIVLEFFDLCYNYGVQPGVITAEAYSGSNQSLLLTQNNWARGLNSKIFKVDAALALDDPANPGSLLPAYNSGDNVHTNDAGYIAKANAYISAVS